MDRPFRSAQNGKVMAAAAVWLVAAASALADPSQRVSSPILLDSKSAAKLLRTASKPDYPILAKLNYIQGRVRLQVRVTREGDVRDVNVLQGHPFLAASAVETVRDWTYRPLVRGSAAVPFVTVVDMKFSLRQRKLRGLPAQPEEDLRRAVRPPKFPDPPSLVGAGEVVRLRVLVSEEGRVIDSKPLRGSNACFEVARRIVGHWVFQPARWGSIAVPWYLEVDVPIEPSSTHEAIGRPCGGDS